MIATTMVHEFPALAPRAKVHLVDHGHALLAMFADKGTRTPPTVSTRTASSCSWASKVTEIGPGPREAVRRPRDPDALRDLGRRPDGGPVAGAQRPAAGPGRPDRRAAGLHRRGLPGVLAIGDIANIPDKDGKTHPQLGSVALQSGGAAAKTILADLEGKPAKPFHYLDKGTMAMIGRGRAIAQVPPGVELHGKLAFAAWLGVHAALMTGGSNRVDAFKSWAVDFFGKERAPQALDRSGEPRMHWEDDDVAVVAATQPEEMGDERRSTYDVIIIGSGAGGGTLAGHLAPSGKRILLLERGDWLPREIENWDADEVFVKNRYVSKDTWYDERARASSRGSTTTSAARRSSTAPRSTGSGGRTSASSAPRRHLARVADLVRRPRAVLHEGRAALRGPRQPRRGPDRAASEHGLPVPGRLPRAADPAAVRRPRAGRLPPVPRAVRHPAARGRHAEQPVHPLRDLRRLPVARPGQVRRRDLRRPAGPPAPERHARSRTPRGHA